MAHTIMRVPDEWLRLMRRFEEAGCYGVAIAGGAMRDLDNGRPVKDIDLWMNGDDIETLNERLDRVCDGWPMIEDYPEFFPSMQETKNTVLSIVRSYYAPDVLPPVNIISVRRLTMIDELLRSFDFGICQIGCLSSGQVVFTDEYLRDKRNKTFTFVDPDGEPAQLQSYIRWLRLSEKYPGWTVCGLEDAEVRFNDPF